MNLLITGITGMLGSHLYDADFYGYKVFTTSTKFFGSSKYRHKNFNLKNESYNDLLNWAKPEVIIHCAANTNLDQCEESLEETVAVNSLPLKKLLTYKTVKKIIYISSDAIYGNISNRASENDLKLPINIYGKSKLLGEQIIMGSNKKYCILRCTPVGINKINFNNNLLTWVIKKIRSNEYISLYKDCFFSPISCHQLVNEIGFCLLNNVEGIFNLSGNFSMSKLEFGVFVNNISKGRRSNIIESSYYYNGIGAQRPKNQVLSNKKYVDHTDRKVQNMNSFKKDLNKYVKSFK